MSIIVKGMKMPTNCKHCPFIVSTICYITNKDNLNVRQDDCPLVEIPKYHGRLIDVDNLDPDTDYDDGEFFAYSIRQIHDTPTILEAEEAEE